MVGYGFRQDYRLIDEAINVAKDVATEQVSQMTRAPYPFKLTMELHLDGFRRLTRAPGVGACVPGRPAVTLVRRLRLETQNYSVSEQPRMSFATCLS